MSNYGWIITRDIFAEQDPGEPNNVGTLGPSSIPEVRAIKLRGGMGDHWRCKDAEGWILYEGRYIGPQDESMFGPLDDFCKPNVGCILIEYKDDAGRWQQL